MTVDFKFVPGDMVLNPFGENVLICMSSLFTGNIIMYNTINSAGQYLLYEENQLKLLSEYKKN